MEKIYTWVPWFKELAQNITNGGEAYLSDRAKRVDWGTDDPVLLRHGDENIDPFSFFYFLAQKSRTTNQRETVFPSVHEEFGIRSALPDVEDKDQWIFPTPSAINTLFFHPNQKKEPGKLWRAFRKAAQQRPVFDENELQEILAIKNVGVAKLTQSLFLINPYSFLPVDDVSLGLLQKLRNCSQSKIETSMKNEGWEYYRPLMEDYKGRFPGREYYEINYEMFTRNDAPQNSMNSLNRILYGPPGTGKTWNTVNHALAIIEGRDVAELEDEDRVQVKQRFDDLRKSGQIEMVTFHQNFAYEDFIEGIRPVMDDGDATEISYKIENGVFKRICERAGRIDYNEYQQEDKPHVLIIDEINRGNIAKIFGELITLIEETKRIGGDEATRATLPYSRTSFGVPDNLYIIGTMNTADRSIALLDTALRRRFDFIEMMPQPKHPLIRDNIDGVDCQEMLRTMNQRITALLDREHQIGHSYLININSMKKLARVFQNQIIPLLQEYFYDDWAKIDLVLNGNGFVLGSNVDIGLFNNTDLVNADRMIYELLDSTSNEWTNPERYQKIYGLVQPQADDNNGE